MIQASNFRYWIRSRIYKLVSTLGRQPALGHVSCMVDVKKSGRICSWILKFVFRLQIPRFFYTYVAIPAEKVIGPNLGECWAVERIFYPAVELSAFRKAGPTIWQIWRKNLGTNLLKAALRFNKLSCVRRWPRSYILVTPTVLGRGPFSIDIHLCLIYHESDSKWGRL